MSRLVPALFGCALLCAPLVAGEKSPTSDQGRGLKSVDSKAKSKKVKPGEAQGLNPQPEPPSEKQKKVKANETKNTKSTAK
jgi:hypothetical protein